MSITTEEQRRQLEASGWSLTFERSKSEAWCEENGHELEPYLDSDGGVGVELHPNGTLFPEDVVRVVAALSILQIPIPGYRIIREEGAEGAGV